MTNSPRGDFFLSARGLAVALVGIALLAFVLPFAVARRLHQARLSRAEVQVRTVAEEIGARLAGLAPTLQAQEVGVLSGPGDPILLASDGRWIAARIAPLRSFAALAPDTLSADPWLRALQVNVGARQMNGRVWVLSAGPNGIIETPFASSGAPAGDDIAAPVP